MTEKPSITIAHHLPGRIRLHLSHGLKSPEQAISSVKTQPGILTVDYSPVSRSVLVRFDPLKLSGEKVIIRAALCLSLDHGKTPVKILAKPAVREWSDSPFYSGLALMAALAARLVRLDPRTALAVDWIAGLSTAGAVLYHGWIELRRKGYSDPEVLSVVYLGAAFIRGRVLTASLVTWLTTFGRHLFKPAPRGMELRVTHLEEDSAGLNRYGIIVSTHCDENRPASFSTFVPAAIRYALVGGASSGEGVLSDLRDLVTIRGEALEGFAPVRNTLPPLPVRVVATN